MEIAFVPAKRASTLAERGLDFLDAAAIFDGSEKAVPDLRFHYPEPRWLTYGRLRGRLVAVVWTEVPDGIRVISMRRPTFVSSETSTGKWVDPDDAPEFTEEMAEMAQWSEGGRITKPATGVLTKDGMKRVPRCIIPIPARARRAQEAHAAARRRPARTLPQQRPRLAVADQRHPAQGGGEGRDWHGVARNCGDAS